MKSRLLQTDCHPQPLLISPALFGKLERKPPTVHSLSSLAPLPSPLLSHKCDFAERGICCFCRTKQKADPLDRKTTEWIANQFRGGRGDDSVRSRSPFPKQSVAQPIFATALNVILLFLFTATLCAAQASLKIDPQTEVPQIKNAKLETVPATGPLAQQIDAFAARQNGTAWIGYMVPAVASNRTICCFDGGWQERGCCGTCRLESEHNNYSGSRDDCDEVEQKTVAVLYRIEDKKIGSIRLFSENCSIDAGGLPVAVITGVDARQSVEYLGRFVTKTDDSHLGRRAIDAIAEHADASADAALDRFVAAEYPEKIREHSAFWLGVTRGAHGYATLKRLIESDPDDHFRDKLTFPLSQSREAQAQDELIHVAKQDSSSRVRGQALFWLAQKAGKKVAGVIGDSIENDPDTDVKKKAVFALSQLPDHEGVPKLIEVARNNRNPVVRKQAVFWLGQSDDPRALDFITSVLMH